MEENTSEPRWSIEWIDSEESLEGVSETLRSQEIVSVDTETVGWQSGNERLCLIQIGIPEQEHTLLIDPLKLGDLKPLQPVLDQRRPELIAHNAPFEERQFGRYGFKMRGVVDTLTMARKLRPDLPNHTLKTCCRYLLDIDISKTEQTSDWSIRPLQDKQIQYAALDAEIAFYLYQVLFDMESKLQVDPNLGVPELMAVLSQATSQRMELTKSIAADLALLEQREELLKNAIRSKLVEGAKPYQGPFGSASVQKIKKTEIDPNAVRQHLPDIADLVIQEHVQRKRLVSVMKEHTIEKDKIDLVTNIIGYNDRLKLSVSEK